MAVAEVREFLLGEHVTGSASAGSEKQWFYGDVKKGRRGHFRKIGGKKRKGKVNETRGELGPSKKLLGKPEGN